ncbi:hypothetical protein QOZ80_5BG0409390 [Eleusine coracana subsp. coracana]|nr:hypothetical protein QOZ80_5BG0409390 [Eleusine coracana subsp. coracana]
MAAHGKPKPAGPAPPPPPPPPPPEAKKTFMRRMFPFLLAANIFVGAYVLVRTYQKDSGEKDAATATAPTSSAATADKPAEPIAPPRKVLPPIPEDEQRQLYKWMLEEKRKTKPRNAAEKKKLDEEKALLKEFIRAESLPSL